MRIVGLDLEYSREAITVLGLSWDEGKVTTATNNDVVVMDQFLHVLGDAEVLVGQNVLDADMMQLRKAGVDISTLLPKTKDIRLMFHAVASHLAGTGSFDLRSIALLVGGRQGYRYPLEFKQYATDILKTCALDAGAALWAYTILERQVTSAGLQATVDISHRCQPIFSLMHEQGVRLDTNVLAQIHAARKAKTAEVIERYRLWEERGKKKIKRVPIWRSNKLLDIFQAQFGVRPKDRKRATWVKLSGDPSLSTEAKEFVEAIIDLGKGANDAHWLGDAEETGDGVTFDKVGADGFIHPRYDICGSPDRAIASGPNIQNFPRPSDDPRPIKLRSAVVAKQPGHVLLGCDFSSVETITNAYESRDMDRVQAVLEKRISHEDTAKLINDAMGLSLNRTQGKIANHGFDKGESPYNLARGLFKTERPSRQQTQMCHDISAKMLAEYPKTAAFRDQLWEQARNNPLTVTNGFGRRLMCFSRSKYGDAGERYAKHDAGKKYWCSCGECAPRRDRWKYAIAFLGRSAAFDALLRVMAKVWYEKRLGDYSLPYLECHDELVYSVSADMAEHYKPILKATFEEPFPELGGISLPASAVIGDSWAEAH